MKNVLKNAFPEEKERFEKKGNRNTNTICLYFDYKTMGNGYCENYFKNKPGNARGCDNSKNAGFDERRPHVQLVLEFNYFRAHASHTTSCSYMSAMSIAGAVNLRG